MINYDAPALEASQAIVGVPDSSVGHARVALLAILGLMLGLSPRLVDHTLRLQAPSNKHENIKNKCKMNIMRQSVQR
jgi:hypothetical protein